MIVIICLFFCLLQTTLDSEPEPCRQHTLNQYTGFLLPSNSSTGNKSHQTAVEIPLKAPVLEEADKRPATTLQSPDTSDAAVVVNQAVSDHPTLILHSIVPVPESMVITTTASSFNDSEKLAQTNMSIMTQIIEVKPPDVKRNLQNQTATILSTDTTYQTAMEEVDVRNASASSNPALSFNTARQSLSDQTDGALNFPHEKK